MFLERNVNVYDLYTCFCTLFYLHTQTPLATIKLDRKPSPRGYAHPLYRKRKSRATERE